MADMDMDMSTDMDSDSDVSVDVSGDYEGFDEVDEPEYFTAEELENHFEALGDDKEALSNYRDLLESGEVAVWEEEINEEVSEPEYFTAEELESHFEALGDDKEALSNYRDLLESGEVAVWEEEINEEVSEPEYFTAEELENHFEMLGDDKEALSNYRDLLESGEVAVWDKELDDQESVKVPIETAETEAVDALELESENIAPEYEQMDVDEVPVEEISEIDINYDEIYEAIEQESLAEGFEDIEITRDAERLDSSLDSFEPSNWENLSLDEQKQSMETLADYVVDAVGLKNPPTIEYYNNAVEGDYGGFDASTNTLRVNEYMLYQSDEAVDTIAHEVWHAHQYECAANPQCARDHQYRYNFQNYISSEYGQEAYESQLIEAEARAFASQFKNRLSFIKGR